jgi:hypothetical protein
VIGLEYDPKAPKESVLLVVATYGKAPDSDLRDDATNANWDMFIRRTSTLAVFNGDNGQFSRASRAFSEIRFTTHDTADHETFTLSVQGTGKKMENWESRVREYWETNFYKPIWDGFIWKEFQYIYTGTVVPLNIVVDGPPVRMSPLPETAHHDSRAKDFYLYNGVSAQSHYNTPETYQCSEEWLKDRLKEVVQSRGYTVDWFTDIGQRVFGRSERRLDVEFHLLKAFAVRVCTIHCETIPYLYDICFSNQNKVLGYDYAVNAAAFFGDCEDVARTIYRIAITILKGTWTDPAILELQRVIAFIGVPVGMGGRGQAPVLRHKTTKKEPVTDDDKKVAHQFAALVPVDLIHRALLGRNSFSEETRARWAKRFRLDPKGFYWTAYPAHAAIMEGTMVTTPFYSETSDEATFKDAMFSHFRNILVMEGEDECVWKRCALEYPLSSKVSSGCTVHAKVQRMYSAMFQELYPDTPVIKVECMPRSNGQAEVDLRYHQSFAISTVDQESNGIAGPVFFSALADPNKIPWKLQVTTPMTKQVFEKEKHVRDQFDRPVQCLLARKPEAAGQCVLKIPRLNGDSQMQLRKEPPTSPIPKERTRRLMVIAWVLDGPTMTILNKLLHDAQQYAKVTRTIVPYDNCYAAVYHW